MHLLRLIQVSTLAAAVGVAVVALRPAVATAEDEDQAQGENCSFRSDPDEFLAREGRTRETIYRTTDKVGRSLASRGASYSVSPSEMPRRNFIDDAIFGKLQEKGFASAPLSTDEEFLRRITLDLTGRIPSPQEIRDFTADGDPGKRDKAIDRLLFSAEFNYRWANWFGDLLQNKAFTAVGARSQQVLGRNALHDWILKSVAEQKSLRDISYETVVGRGNNFTAENGPSNWVLGALTTMGPIQDTYDTMLARTASTFLGISHFDCLLCHDGRGHLDLLSLWGRTAKRAEAQRMASHFSRVRFQNRPNPPAGDASTEVLDNATGQYDLNTTSGNRPSRVTMDENGRRVNNYTPQYVFTKATPAAGTNWRVAFAAQMVEDPMFARNWANRIWKQLFNSGLVEPVDTLDPARLDSKNPPPLPWEFQTPHVELLDQLAQWLRDNNYNFREFLRLIVTSNAYQLSARYDGPWSIEAVPYFARRYARRLEGEEVHDAIAKATGVMGSYTVQGWSEPARWAMDLPEPVEPRSNGGVNNFMNNFLRGNRDTAFRSQAGSIQQQMALMNDNFVLSRMRASGNSASPVLREIAGMSDNRAAVEELYLRFLSRRPTESEWSKSVAFLSRARNANERNTALEDLAWACVNKIDFLFSY
ncbi:MAG: DUF1553 domain-containing protein [Bryobacteraceae bacterium]|nr:DUF1553 domain-containing protein [Bryobacteraceae bacterium]